MIVFGELKGKQHANIDDKHGKQPGEMSALYWLKPCNTGAVRV